MTASVDNQSNGFTLDKFGTTKYPLGLVLMELAEQLEAANLLLGVCWRPREENEPADALTNGDFAGFRPERRVQAAGNLSDQVQAEKLRGRARGGHSGPHGGGGGRKRPRRDALRERQPW